MEKWFGSIDKRCSIRKYSGTPTVEEIESLQEFADGLCARGVRIVVGSSDKVFSSRLPIDRIKGTECFAAILSRDGKSSSVGYIGELFVLECVARGYGTCWLGSSFRLNAAIEAVEPEDSETLVCVTPIGIPGELFKLRPRRSVTSLTGLKVKDYMDLPKWQQDAIECARRSPSAANAQPWSFEVSEGGLSVVNTSSNLGYGRIDCGIAMLHAELGAAHNGVYGDWIFSGNKAMFYPYPEGSDNNNNSVIDYGIGKE